MLSALLRRMITDEGVEGGGIAVARRGELVFEEYAGKARPGVAANEETLWPLASISKIYTAAVVTALVERGLLTFSRKVGAVIPAFTGEGREKITVRQLLTHTSGLTYESLAMETLLAAQTPLDRIVDEAYALPLLFEPGTDQRYSDLGYALAGRVAETVAGKTLPDLVRELVLTPAGLANTFMPPAPGDFGRVARVSGVLAEGTDGAMYNSAYALGLAHPAFGAVASLRDLVHFGLTFTPCGRSFLSPAGVAMMTTDQTGNDWPGFEVHRITGAIQPWAIGFMLKGRASTPELASPQSFGHAGASGCILHIDPVAEIVIGFVSNRHERLGFDDFMHRLDRVVNTAMATFTRS
jgi:CubicO group peptidase (beta-lactamase class C family)